MDAVVAQARSSFSQAIHNFSPRRQLRLHPRHAPFGYEKRAFTGAGKGSKRGLFEFTHRGTLLLDMMEGMNPSLPLKMLGGIQEKEMIRVGGRITLEGRQISAELERTANFPLLRGSIPLLQEVEC